MYDTLFILFVLFSIISFGFSILFPYLLIKHLILLSILGGIYLITSARKKHTYKMTLSTIILMVLFFTILNGWLQYERDKFLIYLVKGRTEDVEKCILAGDDVNQIFEYGWTPLTAVLHKGYDDREFWILDDIEITEQNKEQIICENISVLLRYGADINKPDYYKRPPLIYAIDKNYVQVVKLLLKNRVDLDQTFEGKTYLDCAREWGRSEIVELIELNISSGNTMEINTSG